ncbi:MAG: undecaprenyldiphospho-muramoylpentapeptide beta-N-acetylglucosaminyltransferase [Spirochaetaceae bacterium]
MKKHIIFTGGGTGGHVYPVLSIIDSLIEDGYKVSWIGSKKGIEYKIISDKQIKFYSIPCGKLRRYFSLLNFIDIFKIFAGFIKSFFILLSAKPDFIFSKGGYVSVPPIIVGRLLKIKSVTHESDFSPGLATKINSKFVNKIFIPYVETKDYFNKSLHDKIIVTGNPVREDFFNTNKQNGLDIMDFSTNKPIILILGGSLGAKEINDVILDCASELKDKYNIYHQMGDKNYLEIDEESYKTVSFINNSMADIIKAADLIISRSGASAIWESITVGTPSLFIPLTGGSRGDQVLNANYFKKQGLALVLKDEQVNKNELIKTIDDYFSINRKEIEFNISKIEKKNCAEVICNIIKEFL